MALELASRPLMARSPFIVGIGGTTREGSQSERALGFALRAAVREGADVIAVTGQQLMLPIYAPAAEITADAQKLLALIRRCDGLIVASPSYHGAASGMIKNVLDYVEELRTDTRPYLDGRAIGTIVCAAGWQNVGTTLVGLRSIVHALRGWPTPVGAGFSTLNHVFDASGECADEAVRAQLELMSRQVVEFARYRIATEEETAAESPAV